MKLIAQYGERIEIKLDSEWTDVSLAIYDLNGKYVGSLIVHANGTGAPVDLEIKRAP